ncbi:TolC family protein, partial [Klebsiella pneumoniae]|uniref:TolC family protein n=2 Tax=Pseudomonadota TaxID=1224 RepID=UPI002ED4F139|nr:TolC family protein [Klebsiella pneumoniae]
ATVSVSYNVDVFGSARRQIEGVEAQVDASRFQLEATYLTLTANVVTTALREASLRAQLRATEEIAEAQAQQLRLVQQQFSVGAVPRST